jgi:hypothetical protein
MVRALPSNPRFSPVYGCERASKRNYGVALGKSVRRTVKYACALGSSRAARLSSLRSLVFPGICALSLRAPVRNAGETLIDTVGLLDFLSCKRDGPASAWISSYRCDSIATACLKASSLMRETLRLSSSKEWRGGVVLAGVASLRNWRRIEKDSAVTSSGKEVCRRPSISP